MGRTRRHGVARLKRAGHAERIAQCDQVAVPTVGRFENPLPKWEQASQPWILEAPDRDAVEASPNALDRFEFQPVERRPLPSRFGDYFGRIPTRTEPLEDSTTDFEQGLILEEPEGILIGGSRQQIISGIHAKAGEGSHRGTRSPAVHSQYGDDPLGINRMGSAGPVSGSRGHGLNSDRGWPRTPPHHPRGKMFLAEPDRSGWHPRSSFSSELKATA